MAKILRTSLSLTDKEAELLNTLTQVTGRSTADYLKRMALGYDTITPEQLKSITNTSSPAKEIAEMVKGKKEGI